MPYFSPPGTSVTPWKATPFQHPTARLVGHGNHRLLGLMHRMHAMGYALVPRVIRQCSVPCVCTEGGFKCHVARMSRVGASFHILRRLRAVLFVSMPRCCVVGVASRRVVTPRAGCRQAGRIADECMDVLEQQVVSLENPAWFVEFQRSANYPAPYPVDHPQLPFTIIGVSSMSEGETTYYSSVRNLPMYLQAFRLSTISTPTRDAAPKQTGCADGGPVGNKVVLLVGNRLSKFFWRCASSVVHAFAMLEAQPFRCTLFASCVLPVLCALDCSAVKFQHPPSFPKRRSCDRMCVGRTARAPWRQNCRVCPRCGQRTP